eukprot:TRINITY_DN67731_c4_g1_i1.p2 TRINITY_DN67731_c4_g1~~TRINITY_DN67731_c4_g1_i1.p2  ORF type:complete len:148 (+),score=11.57 TRINITY_DN67731_c4_g1_i1:187-630(+)
MLRRRWGTRSRSPPYPQRLFGSGGRRYRTPSPPASPILILTAQETPARRARTPPPMGTPMEAIVAVSTGSSAAGIHRRRSLSPPPLLSFSDQSLLDSSPGSPTRASSPHGVRSSRTPSPPPGGYFTVMSKVSAISRDLDGRLRQLIP